MQVHRAMESQKLGTLAWPLHPPPLLPGLHGMWKKDGGGGREEEEPSQELGGTNGAMGGSLVEPRAWL